MYKFMQHAQIKNFYWVCIACLGILVLGATMPAKAAPVVVSGQGITVEGSATKNGAMWEYRYTITDTNGAGITPIRFIISEDPPHPHGSHDETNFKNAGGTFQYDFTVPAIFVGISAHNYFWNDLGIPAAAIPPTGVKKIVIGFDDTHPPTMQTWGIQARGNHVELNAKLPVPTIPEPATICLLGLGGLMLRRRRV